MTLQTMVKEYIETLNSPPNAWGQHYHQGTGLVSHSFLRRMYEAYGTEETNAALDKAFGHCVDMASLQKDQTK